MLLCLQESVESTSKLYQSIYHITETHADFYQTLWEVINSDPMALFADFRQWTLPLFQLDHYPLAKETRWSTNSVTSPYFPLKCQFKIFTKMDTNGFIVIVHNEIRPTHTTILPWWFGKGLKVDFGKAYHSQMAFSWTDLPHEGFHTWVARMNCSVHSRWECWYWSQWQH